MDKNSKNFQSFYWNPTATADFTNSKAIILTIKNAQNDRDEVDDDKKPDIMPDVGLYDNRDSVTIKMASPQMPSYEFEAYCGII